MPWGTLDLVASLRAGGDPFLATLADLAGGEGAVVYGAGGAGGGLVAWRAEGGRLVELDRAALPVGQVAGTGGDLTVAGGIAAVTGVAGAPLWAQALGADGGFAGREGIEASAPLPLDLSATVAVERAGGTWLYGLRLGSERVTTWRLGEEGALARVSDPNPSRPDAAGEGMADLAYVEAGGRGFLVGAAGPGDAAVLWRIEPNGVPVEVARLGAAEGLGVDGPAGVAAAEVGGRAYAVVAAAGSGTLSVLEVGADGTLRPADHVMDDLGTRFGGARLVEAVVAGGRAFVAAAGSDDGVTLFELLPGGRLLEIATLEDAAGLPLANASALLLRARGGRLDLFVASGAGEGLAWLGADLPAGAVEAGGAGAEALEGGGGDDLLDGGGGSDRLAGGAGADVLLDGAGSDALAGGAGRDVFVLSDDGAADAILDFDPAEDRLDLSAWRFLRTAAQVAVTPTPTGAILSFGAESLRLVSAAGGPFGADLLRGLDLIGVSRVLPSWTLPVVPSRSLLGGAGGDTLVGGEGGDVLDGRAGPDSLEGLGGLDTLLGGDGDDALSGGAEADSLCGGMGDDALRGGDGDDDACGEEGRDSLWGGEGQDTLDGGAGDDALRGEAGNDRLLGGAGLDWLSGGDGNDSLLGGEDDDRLSGIDGNDRIAGEGGDDLLYAGRGHDALDGGSGDDRLDGSIGNDRLLGGTGDDVVFGGDGRDLVQGGEGLDRVWTGEGDDSIVGGGGDDALRGDGGADRLDGDAGRDRLYGGEGDDAVWGDADGDSLWGMGGGDRLYGGDGADLMRGDGEADTLQGGAGGDLMLGGTGADLLLGESGDDRIAGGEDADSVVAGSGDDSVTGDGGNDALDGGLSADRLDGGEGNDRLWGGDADDWVAGGVGNDALWGNAGTDSLWGGSAADRLYGGAGNDRLWGGSGADAFVFEGGRDRVEDFEDGVDAIRLDADLWGGRLISATAALGFAGLEGGNAVFRFSGGNVLIVEGMTSLQRLRDDLEVV